MSVGPLTAARAGFQALYEQHLPAVLAYALRRAASEADAEDVAAETFAIAWRRADAIPDEPLPWLYGVARRVLANQRRSGRRRAGLLERLRLHTRSAEQQIAGGGPAVDALATLDPDDQELLRLVAWEELSHGEIGVVLGVTANAVAIRLHRARKRYAAAYDAITSNTSNRVKESADWRTSKGVTGRTVGTWRHEETR